MRDRVRRVTKVGVAVGTALALVEVGLVLSLNALGLGLHHPPSWVFTPGSGTRPDTLTQAEQANLSTDGTTGAGAGGAVWNLYYAQLPSKANPPLQPLRLQDRISMTGG